MGDDHSWVVVECLIDDYAPESDPILDLVALPPPYKTHESSIIARERPFQLDDQKIDKETHTASTLSFFLFNLSHLNLHVRPVVIVITLFIVVGTVDIYDLLFVI